MAQTSLKGTVVRITFRNDETGYTVAKVRYSEVPEKIVAVLGSFPSLDEGEYGEFKGEWSHDKKWGKQFKAASFVSIIPGTVTGIELLLSKGNFRGIGPKFAKSIVNYFGEKTLEIIEKEPHKLSQIEGIGSKKIEEVKKAWQEKKALKNILLFLAEYKIPFRFSTKIYQKYGDNAIIVIKNNPYQLIDDIPGVGFATADGIGLSIGIKENAPERIKGTINHFLKKAAEEGHTFLPKEELKSKVYEFIGVSNEEINHNIEVLREGNRIIVDDDRVYIRWLFTREQLIALRVQQILSTEVEAQKAIEPLSEIKRIEQQESIAYSDRQKEAITEALKQKMIIITGGPGTGKTTIIKGLLKLLEKRGERIRLAAPTGRAAKRMNEACGFPSQTIHRLLDFDPRSNSFTRSLAVPLDTDVVIIDETSMIDTPLMASLLCGIANTSRVVFVGDVDQLPSVGPGNVLKNMIDSGKIPVIKLNTIFRQAEESDIIVSAHIINSGEVPKIDNKKSENFYFLKEDDNAQIPAIIADLVKKRLPEKYKLDPLKDIQVLTSMYKGDTGALNLNAILQEQLLRQGNAITKGERKFLIGDKVMQIRNNYNKNIYNGDIGFIKRIDNEEKLIFINYDGLDVEYKLSELDEIVHAYAITVHKSQGSEYKAVVMPITTQHYIMLQKNLIYTAITRAKELIVLVGTRKALHIAVKNNATTERYTYLTERLRSSDASESQLNLLTAEMTTETNDF